MMTAFFKGNILGHPFLIFFGKNPRVFTDQNETAPYQL